ncbi:MAG TPA: NADH-quinone oxidoreductase subunit NuoB [Solirubrobacterales bacterium]|nr:NADH-quinone oxidoreductase subunit NuoB [Solirubrobacterales bacterium]
MGDLKQVTIEGGASGSSGFATTKLDALLAWARKWSLFKYPFVTACCGMEFMALTSPRFDGSARFGAEAPRFSPRQSDLLWVVGTISQRQAPVLKRIYEQMMEPKWVLAFGTCASCGGFYDNYTTIPGIDKIIPCDIYVPGCPPRPEAVLYGFTKLQRQIMGNPDQGWRQRYNAYGTEEWARGGPRSEPSPEAARAYEEARELSLA